MDECGDGDEGGTMRWIGFDDSRFYFDNTPLLAIE